MSSQQTTKWYAEVPAEGTFFYAVEVLPDTRLANVEGAIRIYAPRVDHKSRINQATRYMIVEGQPLDPSHFLYCSGNSCGCDHRPSWIEEGERHMPVGQFPCHMETAINIAAHLLEWRLDSDTNDLSYCRGHGHVAVYNNGWAFMADHESKVGAGRVGVDVNSAFREFGEDVVREYWASEDRRREEYVASFVPKPCPVCGHPPQTQR